MTRLSAALCPVWSEQLPCRRRQATKESMNRIPSGSVGISPNWRSHSQLKHQNDPIRVQYYLIPSSTSSLLLSHLLTHTHKYIQFCLTTHLSGTTPGWAGLWQNFYRPDVFPVTRPTTSKHLLRSMLPRYSGTLWWLHGLPCFKARLGDRMLPPWSHGEPATVLWLWQYLYGLDDPTNSIIALKATLILLLTVTHIGKYQKLEQFDMSVCKPITSESVAFPIHHVFLTQTQKYITMHIQLLYCNNTYCYCLITNYNMLCHMLMIAQS